MIERPECPYFRKERYPTNEDETHFEIIPWCDCNGRPDYTNHAAAIQELREALEGCLGFIERSNVPEGRGFHGKTTTKARATLDKYKEES